MVVVVADLNEQYFFFFLYKQADRGCAPGLVKMVESTYIRTLIPTIIGRVRRRH